MSKNEAKIKGKATEIKLKKTDDESVEKEIEGVMNAVKTNKVENGIIPKSPSIVINNFAGKKLIRDKSIVKGGNQYFMKKGTAWEDVDMFFRRHCSFSDKDFD